MRANIPKGMGGPQNMQALLRQVQKTQEEVAAKQDELDAREYEFSAGGGAVNAKVNGKKELLTLDKMLMQRIFRFLHPRCSP